MKLWKYGYILALPLLFLGACKSPVYVQKDDSANLNNYHSYMWVDTRANENDNSKRRAAYADISVRNAVNRELNKAGWREVSSDPDVLVSYDVLIERSSQQRQDPVYSQPFSRMYFNPYTRRWSTIYYPSQFMGYDTYEEPVREGTITISMLDARTDKLVWQAWTTENMENSRLTTDEISKSVRNIFNKFDVASR
jgi:hypothetical protein